jgi:nucleoside-diphosphate-sugar epimerase
MNFYKNKKIVVTGGAGFIGSNLVEALVYLGARVTVIDNLRTGKIENLATVASEIAFIQGDIRDKELCIKGLTNADIVFHLAAQVSVPESMNNPDECFEINVTGTFNLLEAARKHTIKRFLFSSSCAVYGEKNEPCIETMSCAPTSPYAYSKLLAEQLCQQYSRIFKVPTICFRYFNVFGFRQDPSSEYAGVVAKFNDKMLKNEPITIFGDGSQSRDFVPVSQIVQTNLEAAQLADTFCKGEPINVATGESTSILELFNDYKKITPWYTHKPEYAPARIGEVKQSQADCTRYRKLFDQLK